MDPVNAKPFLDISGLKEEIKAGKTGRLLFLLTFFPHIQPPISFEECFGFAKLLRKCMKKEGSSTISQEPLDIFLSTMRSQFSDRIAKEEDLAIQGHHTQIHFNSVALFLSGEEFRQKIQDKTSFIYGEQALLAWKAYLYRGLQAVAFSSLDVWAATDLYGLTLRNKASAPLIKKCREHLLDTLKRDVINETCLLTFQTHPTLVALPNTIQLELKLKAIMAYMLAQKIPCVLSSDQQHVCLGSDAKDLLSEESELSKLLKTYTNGFILTQPQSVEDISLMNIIDPSLKDRVREIV
jgi:hypothetical protein